MRKFISACILPLLVSAVCAAGENSASLNIMQTSTREIPEVSPNAQLGAMGYNDFIAGTVFNDVNANGIKDNGESGLSNWWVYLFKADSLVGSILTDSVGGYSFSSLAPGTYVLRDSAQSGWLPTLPASGGGHTVPLIEGQHITGMNFGNFRQVSISGTIFHDLNGNAAKEVSEPGLSNWRLDLFIGNTHVDSIITDSLGGYIFNNLGPGIYNLSEALQPAWLQSIPTSGGRYYINTRSGQNIAGLDFGNYQTGSIAGMTFHDLNGNGIKDTADTSLGNWQIRLLKGNVLVDSQLTGASGGYAFTNLRPGAYTVLEQHQSGWTQTVPASGMPYSFLLLSTQNLINENFGNFGNGMISGLKFKDVNGDGVKAAGDTGLASWRIYLTKGGLRIDSALTDDSGHYAFINVGPGIYTTSEQQITGWTQTLPPLPGVYTDSLTSFGHLQGRNFGNFRNSILRGVVFYDRNGNGVFDGNETGLTGWTINAIATHPQNNRSTITQAGGQYAFTDLFPDTYTITETLKSHWSQTYPLTGTYALVVGRESDTSGFNFGNTNTIDTTLYRTFLQESLMVKKAIARTVSATRWCFEINNSSGSPANGLRIVFTKDVNSFSSVAPFDSLQLVGPKTWQFSGATVDPGRTIQICGVSSKMGMMIRTWWWTYGDASTGPHQLMMPPASQGFLYPMPNGANLREEVYLQAFGSTGMVIGIPQTSGNTFGWARLIGSYTIQQSLNYRGITHTGAPMGFVKYQGRPFRGIRRSMPPQYHNNRLFADLVVLKFNIAASALGRTPPGLGELIYEEGSNPLSGLMVKQLAARTDSNLTYWVNVPPSAYLNLDTVIQKINAAFVGPVDTVSFVNRLQFTGVRPVTDVPFLRPNSSVQPFKITPLNDLTDELPPQFLLHQNYPNPFNPTTTIEFSVPQQASATLKVYNTLGQEVATLLNGEILEEGIRYVEFDGGSLSSGIYFYRLTLETAGEREVGAPGGTYSQVKKMLLVK